MKRHQSYISNAIQLIEAYKGDTPFHNFIKHFFDSEKKFGSNDRRQITELCYCWFRLGLVFHKQLNEENMLAAFFLCNDEPAEMIRILRPEWFEKTNSSFHQKVLFLKDDFSEDDIFPYKNELPGDIDFGAFCRSFTIQPDLFIRIRPKHKIAVLKKIKIADIPHRYLNHESAAEFPPGTKIENFLEPDSEVVIQDHNSQLVLNYLQENLQSLTAKNKPAGSLSVWDCCAASGGKSILLTDIIQQKINLTVSDIRPASILKLHQRFKKAAIKEYQYFITDISNLDGKVPLSIHDVIICDAPCTGSGTWSRTPEQLYLFHPASIIAYSEKQKKIVDNASLHLKEGGLFVYITCSVFKKENEEVATYIESKLKLQLVQMQHLYGYDKKADSMFVAVFKSTAAGTGS